MPLQGRCRAIANKITNETRNVIGHMTTVLIPVRATRKKKIEDYLKLGQRKSELQMFWQVTICNPDSKLKRLHFSFIWSLGVRFLN